MTELPTVSDLRSLLLEDRPLLDVRAPVEFARGAFPASVNLPLMNDSEREAVGIRYKQAGQESAIALGAELLTDSLRSERVERWCEFARRHPDGALYCFRGGLRSRIAQRWLADAGHSLPRVAGGYKALRTLSINTLEQQCAAARFLLIGGRTGTGKTLIIRRLARAVDLEALAGHRGSSFGRLADEQPTNISFENALALALLRLAPSFDVDSYTPAAIALEDEARLIGRVCLPDPLRLAMDTAPAVLLETPMAERVDIAIEDYVLDLLDRYGGQAQGFEPFAEHHRSSLQRVQKRLGGNKFRQAGKLLEAALAAHRKQGDVQGYRPFIELMLSQYYDPMYDYQLARKQRRIVFRGNAVEIMQWVEKYCRVTD